MLDGLTGNDEAHRVVDGHADLEASQAGWRGVRTTFTERFAPHLLYDPAPGTP